MGYLDPSLFGLITQLGYILLFGIVTALFSPLKIVKKIFKAMSSFVRSSE